MIWRGRGCIHAVGGGYIDLLSELLALSMQSLTKLVANFDRVEKYKTDP